MYTYSVPTISVWVCVVTTEVNPHCFWSLGSQKLRLVHKSPFGERWTVFPSKTHYRCFSSPTDRSLERYWPSHVFPRPLRTVLPKTYYILQSISPVLTQNISHTRSGTKDLIHTVSYTFGRKTSLNKTLTHKRKRLFERGVNRPFKVQTRSVDSWRYYTLTDTRILDLKGYIFISDY